MTRPLSLSRKQLLISIGIAMAVLYVILIVLDRKLQEAGGPSIVGFEFAGSEQQAAQIMAEWGDSGRDYARWSLWIDFGLMLSYGAFFALAALATRDFARENNMRRLAAVGAVAPLCAALAAAFDVVENTFLLLVLGGHGGSFGPPIAATCASIKFLLFAIAVAYVLWGLASRLLLRGRPSEAPEP